MKKNEFELRVFRGEIGENKLYLTGFDIIVITIRVTKILYYIPGSYMASEFNILKLTLKTFQTIFFN